MLFILAVTLGVLSLIVVTFRPYYGILMLIVCKPIIDTGFYKLFLFGLSITRIVAAVFPFIILFIIMRAKPSARLDKMPLMILWLLYFFDIFMFSSITVVSSGIKDGIEMFLRHSHGFVGFYMIQAFFNDRESLKQLLKAFIIAGFFPVGVGIYQMLTGQILSPLAGGDMVEGLQRNVGFYHDVFTVRYYALQTLMSIILYWIMFAERQKIIVVTLIGYAMACISVVFKAYTKSGLVTLALWAMAWTVLQRKYMQLVAIIIAIFIISLYFSDSIVATIETIFRKEIGAISGEIGVERTFEGRWYGWFELTNMWSQFGFISKTFGTGMLMTGAHNDYMQMLFHGGVFGLMIYVSLLITAGFVIVRNLFHKIEPLRVAALMLYIMYMIDTIGLVPSSYVGYQWFVWGFIGLSMRGITDNYAGVPVSSKDNKDERIKNNSNRGILKSKLKVLNLKKGQ